MATEDHDATQFRRQLVATLAGALIGMSTSAGTTLFQWITQSRERRYQDRMTTLSQFAATVQMTLGKQAQLWHIANRCNWLAARARRIAIVDPITHDTNVSRYSEWLTNAWQVELEITEQYGLFAKSNADVASAYYRLTLLFDDVPPFDFSSFGERISAWRIMSDLPDRDELLSAAKHFDTMSASYANSAGTLGKWGNKWMQTVGDLKTHAN